MPSYRTQTTDLSPAVIFTYVGSSSLSSSTYNYAEKKLKDSRTEVDVIHLKEGRACMVPMDGGEARAVGKKICVLHISWLNTENMTLVIVLNS